MLVLTCDNGTDRGQLLHRQRPPRRVDMRSLLPVAAWPDLYRQDGIADLLGAPVQTVKVDRPQVARQFPEIATVLIDHEALDAHFADFWETPSVVAGIRRTLAMGGTLWIGFQSSGYLPNWLAELLPGGGGQPVARGEADALVSVADHPLTAGLPPSIDFTCNRLWRALRDMPATEPLDLGSQPDERGSLCWLTVSSAWQVLAHREDHPHQAALALTAAGGGTVVLDQTLALFGANIDSLAARRFAANMRDFLGVEPAAANSAASRWQALTGPCPPAHTAAETVTAGGVPFRLHGNENLLAYTGNTATVPVGGRVDRLHLLGNILSYPMATGAWFVDAMDFREDFFVGDRVGTLTIEYVDGRADEVPLIMGRTICWQPRLLGPGNEPMKPFDEPAARETLFATMALRPGCGEGVGSWVLSIEPRPQSLRRLIVRGNPDRPGVPVYGAITVESSEAVGVPLPVPSAPWEGPALRAPFTVDDADLEPLRHLLYTYPEDLAAAPLAVPSNPVGATIRFLGGRAADVWSCIYAHNLASLGERLHPTAGGPSLATGRVYGTYRQSLGTWRDGHVDPAAGVTFWSRDNGRAGIERLALGLHAGVENELSVWDRLLYWSHPPHTRRSAREMQGPAQWHRRTLAGNCIHVAPENDGHGLLMLYHAAALRHHPDWFDRLWPAMIDYAEWIGFLLDNPVDPQQPADTLYTDSECSGYGHWDIYSNWLCLAGLEAYADIAAGQGAPQADRWRLTADRLRRGIRNGLVDPDGGWHASPFSQWQSLTEALTPLFALPDHRSYDLAQAAPEDLAASRASYARLVAPEHYHLRTRMIGYDHALLTQAALLLDDVERVEKLLDTLAAAIYDAHAPEPWIVAEGAVIPPHQRYWHRLGMGGNTIHLAETLKVVRLLVGMDDLTPGRLRLMPRLPNSWEGMEIADYPLAGGVRATCRWQSEPRVELELSAPLTVDIRLGDGAGLPLALRVNSTPHPVTVDAAGRAWLCDLEGTAFTVEP